ncbi:MAG: hypothetical protein KKE20_07020 [Nanoarchaeota archaeon]|nr:hypothetical protein [Nanoarchaeota archaeon]
MAEQTKKITLYIFLLGLFLTLAFFVGVHIYNIYSSGTRTSTDTTKSSLECSFSFSLNKLTYSFPQFSFNLRTSDIDRFKNLVISVEGIETEVPLSEFFDYEQNVVITDIVIEDTFIVYPKGCKDYNAKQCSIRTNTCKALNY